MHPVNEKYNTPQKKRTNIVLCKFTLRKKEKKKRKKKKKEKEKKGKKGRKKTH